MRKFHPLAVAAEKKGKKIYHLNIGQPDLETPQAFYDAVRSFDGATLEYAASPGVPMLIDAVRGTLVEFSDSQGKNGDDDRL